ncbi:hypothetical protein ACRASX_11295 [Flavobacterium sp. TMP13]|uniref:hypothetical protein n=1 Tax=Flavobacterium sp. TMP13 TaxID=3425950 RepID=UPI003D7880FB
MKIKIWITRSCGGSLTSRGLGNVFVWFQEPCLHISEMNEEMFALNDTFHKSLYGSLYSKNSHHNFLYRSENDKFSLFGTKVIRNADGIDLPKNLVELEKENKLRFEHRVFGDGIKTDYKPTKVPLVFGYDSNISQKIWEMILDEFEGIDQREWSELDNNKPFWKFCKQMEIEILNV